MEDENKVQTNNEIDTSQEVDENILAQQPLMAALMSEESAQPPKEEEPVNPVLAPSPVETAPALDTAPVSSEAVPTNQGEEQSQDLSAFQPPSMPPKEEDQEEKKPEKKKINIVKPIVSTLVVIALVVGGVFGYNKIFGGLNPLVKTIDNVADALEYFENKMGIKIEKNDDLSESASIMTYRSDPNTESRKVYITGGKDGQLVSVGYNSKSNDLNKTIREMMPFLKNYVDSSFADVGIRLAKKYGNFDYTGLAELSISKNDDGYVVNIKYGKDQEEKKDIELVSENKIIIKKNISIMEIALKKKYGSIEFEEFTAMNNAVLLGRGDILENKEFVSLSFLVVNTKLSLLSSTEEEKIIKSEKKTLGGKDGYLMVTKEALGDMEFTNWEFYIASDGSQADIENSEEKGYYRIGVAFSKDYLSEAEQEAVLKDAVKNIKLG